MSVADERTDTARRLAVRNALIREGLSDKRIRAAQVVVASRISVVASSMLRPSRAIVA